MGKFTGDQLRKLYQAAGDIESIIVNIDSRCMVFDGPVPPTESEISLHEEQYIMDRLITIARILVQVKDHDLYKTGDPDAPTTVQDQNGEVVLGLCRKCGKAEAELSQSCKE